MKYMVYLGMKEDLNIIIKKKVWGRRLEWGWKCKIGLCVVGYIIRK